MVSKEEKYQFHPDRRSKHRPSFSHVVRQHEIDSSDNKTSPSIHEKETHFPFSAVRNYLNLESKHASPVNSNGFIFQFSLFFDVRDENSRSSGRYESQIWTC
jgi:hypothetical protein